MTTKQTRLKPEVRRESILAAAFTLAAKGHYLTTTRSEIAEAAGISGTAVQYHFKSMQKLRDAVVRAAIGRQFLPIVAQAITANDRLAHDIPESLKARAMMKAAGALS